MRFTQEVIFVRLLLPLVCGIGITYKFPSATFLKLCFPIICILLLCIVWLSIRYIHYKLYNRKYIIGAFIFCLFTISGSYITLKNQSLLYPQHFSKTNYDYLKLRISDEPVSKQRSIRFIAEVLYGYKNGIQTATIGNLLINIEPSPKSKLLQYGHEIIVPVKYTLCEPAKNPGTFDYSKWLASKDIFHQQFVSANSYINLNTFNGNPLIAFALNFRKKQVNVYKDLLPDQEAYAVAATLLLGFRSELSEEIISAYSKTGTIHALSVSGAHVAIIYAFLNFLLSFFSTRFNLLVLSKTILICLLLWSYALLTGFSPSVLRAVIMITVFILAKTYAKDINSYNVLSFTAFCLLLYQPLLLIDLGFQLSFLAVFGLIWLQPLIYETLFVANNYLDKLWKLVAMSIAAQIITFPLSVYYFHQFPVYFLLGNIFILLPINIIMALGTIVLLPGMAFLAPALQTILDYTNAGLQWIADLPFSNISAIYLNILELFLLFTGTVGIFIALNLRKAKILICSLALLLLLQLLLSSNKLKCAHQRKIIFYNMQRGYASAFITGKDAIVVTHLQKKDKDFQYQILPALALYKVSTINVISLQDKYGSAHFRMEQNQILFFNYSILLINKYLENKVLLNNPNFNAIWLTEGVKPDLLKINQTVQTNTIVMDATIPAYAALKSAELGKKTNGQVFYMKKNPALEIDLRK